MDGWTNKSSESPMKNNSKTTKIRAINVQFII